MKKILLSAALLLTSVVVGAAEFGSVSPLRVEGNHLVDKDGEQVMLHGVMDTPSPYFSGYRFTDGHPIDVYTQGDQYLQKCKDYFNELFTAVTDRKQGSYCNVFRLHMDPCWTNDGSKPLVGKGGENNISQYSGERLTNYLTKLFVPLAMSAKNKGMYVIMRPPGVCPDNITVGDDYQKYLLDVWDRVTKNRSVTLYGNASNGWLSLELANEPINIYDENGGLNTPDALHDFFQPIVDKIRSNGFEGIIWVPGATWQQNYKGYATRPIIDKKKSGTKLIERENPMLGYAVHFYPGWFSTGNSYFDTNTIIKSFYDMVPVVKDHPIMITEVDWSPKDPTGQGHYNETGDWVEPNCGTWATGETSKFGKAYKGFLDFFGNIGMTLTHTHDYIDIDLYRSSGVLKPAFHNKLDNNAYEACSGACFEWYPQYAAKKPVAYEWTDVEGPESYFPLYTTTTNPLANTLNPSIWENGSFVESTGKLTLGQYGFGGWKYSVPIDLSEYNYIIVEYNTTSPSSLNFRLFDQESYWSQPYSVAANNRSKSVIPLQNQKKMDGSTFNPSHVYIAGFWSNGGSANAVSIKSIYLSNDGKTPVTGAPLLYSDETRSTDAPRAVKVMENGRMVIKTLNGTFNFVGSKISE